MLAQINVKTKPPDAKPDYRYDATHQLLSPPLYYRLVVDFRAKG